MTYEKVDTLQRRNDSSMVSRYYRDTQYRIAGLALAVFIRIPLIKTLSGRRPVVLLYHGVPRGKKSTFLDQTAFERQIVFLKRHCEFVTQADSLRQRNILDKPRVLLTFDDGFRNNAEVVAPILRKHEVPAVFFVCSRHSTPGRYLWFTYLRTLERCFPGDGFHFRGEFIDMSPVRRALSINRIWKYLLNLSPHPAAMYQAIEEELPPLEDFVGSQELQDCCTGITAEQLADLAEDPLFSVGAHTVDHPCLTRCDPKQSLHQLRANKEWIEQISNRPCKAMAYPGGYYNADILRQARDLGFTCCYAVSPLLNLDRKMEVPRIGIYSPSLDILGVKVHWGNAMRALKVKVG